MAKQKRLKFPSSEKQTESVVDLEIALSQDTTIRRTFNQADLRKYLDAHQSDFPTLKRVHAKFDGLCELICNFVMFEDLLGKSMSGPLDLQKKAFECRKINNNEILLKKKNPLKEQINLFALNKPLIKNSHLLNVSSLLEMVIAFLFNKFPYDLFSWLAPVVVDNKVNRTLLGKRLDELPEEAYVKFCVFSKPSMFKFMGHSMLIKKTGHNGYSFFDPNIGEDKHLNADALFEKIDFSMSCYEGTGMAFLDGNSYINNLKKDLDLSQPSI